MPVALHLDHCPDRAVISDVVRAGWSSVLFDASDRDLETPSARPPRSSRRRTRAGVDVESEIENIVGVEDGVGSDVALHAYDVATLAAVAERTGVDLLAPAARHGSRRVQGQAGPAPRPRPRARGPHRPPDRAARRDGPVRATTSGRSSTPASPRSTSRPPSRSPTCARPRRTSRSARERGQVGPAEHVPGHLRRRCRRDRRVHRRVRLGRAGMSPALDLRLRRRARRHRARRPPAGVQPDVRRRRRARSTGRRRSTASCSRSAAARSGSRRCSRRCSSRPRGLPTDPDEQRSSSPPGTRPRPRTTRRWSPAGSCPARPGIARIVEEAAARGWRLAVASTSAEASVRAVLEHAVGAERAARLRGVRGRRRARQEAGARHLPARAARAGPRAATRRSSSRTAPTACGPRSAPGCAPSSP